MKKQVTVEINDTGRPTLGHHEQGKSPVRVFIALEADTIEHAQQDLQAAHVEALMQFEAHQDRTAARAGTIPAAASSRPDYTAIRDAAHRASESIATGMQRLKLPQPEPDVPIRLRPDDDPDDAA
jgi:hypothetical protein